MNITTIIGLIIAFGALMASVILDGGDLKALVNESAALIVFGGTFGAAIVSFPKEQILGLPKLIARAVFDKSTMNEMDTIALMARLSEKARREGLLSLEEETQGIDDSYLQRGAQLIIDGTDPDVVKSILELDLRQMQRRHEMSYGILEAMGGYAPTMGILGAVMGLIRVLGELHDPSNLGPAIAVAFVATLYGVGSANLLWLPLGAKLKMQSEQELLIRELMLEGLLAIQAGENPRIVQEKLFGFLRPSQRRHNHGPAEEEAA